MGWVDAAMRKKSINYAQPSNTPQNRRIESESKKIELRLDEITIKKILSAGASLTSGVLSKR